jgi:sec-independent protein translocase protein TatA
MEFGFGKLLLLVIIILMVFGTGKLPRIGEDLGKAMRSFRKAAHEGGGDAPAGEAADVAAGRSTTASDATH